MGQQSEVFCAILQCEVSFSSLYFRVEGTNVGPWIDIMFFMLCYSDLLDQYPGRQDDAMLSDL